MAVYSETKIVVTLELNDYGTADDIAAALIVLQRLGITPLGKVQLAFSAMSSEAAEDALDNLDAVLRDVPSGVDVKVKETTERGVERRKVDNTPMQKYFNN